MHAGRHKARIAVTAKAVTPAAAGLQKPQGCRHRQGCQQHQGCLNRRDNCNSNDPLKAEMPAIEEIKNGEKLGLYRLKGTVSRDFLLLVFFINQFPPSPRVSH